jgi:hypothetical protein
MFSCDIDQKVPWKKPIVNDRPAITNTRHAVSTDAADTFVQRDAAFS